jgi:autotransporter-associated beta strand protein
MKKRIPSQPRTRTQLHNLGTSTCAIALALAAASPGARAIDVYWDTNGATIGAATSGTANGTWNASTTGNWTTNPAGTSATSTYAVANGSSPSTADVFFSAGTDAIASVNVTLNGPVEARSITIQELMNISATSSSPSLTIGAGGVTLANTVVGPSTWIGTAPVTLSASQAWNNHSSHLFTVAGNVTGAASSATALTLSGTGAGGSTLSGLLANGSGGTLALNINTTGGGITTLSNSSNSFTGGVTLTQGVLRGLTGAATNSTLGAGTLTLAGGELQLQRSTTAGSTFGNATVVTGDSQVTSMRNTSGTGVVHTLGSLSIGAQTLTIASDPLASGTAGIAFGTTTLTGNATFNVVNGPGSTTRLNLGALNGSGDLIKNGNGNLHLATLAGSFSGNTYINNGALFVTNGTALGTGTVNLGAATGNNDATLNITLGNGTLSNNLVVTANSGSAVFRLVNPSAGANTAVTLAGTVALNDDLTLIATAGGGNLTFSNAITGPVSGVSTITHDGTGAVAFGLTSTIGSNINLVQNGGTVSLSGTNTSFNGSVTINGGQLSSSAAGLAAGNNVVTIGTSGTFFNSQGNSAAVVVAGIQNGVGGGGIVNQSGVNRFISLAGSGTYSFGGSIIQGGINKTGTGTQILTGSNTYTAATTISAGTLLVEGSLGNTAVTVNGGVLGGSGSIAGAVSVGSGGTLSPGSSPGTITLGSTLNMLNGSTLAFEGGDLVAVTGQLDLDNNWTLTLGPGFVDGGSVVVYTFGSIAATPDLLPTFDITNLGFTPTSTLTLTLVGNSVVLNGISVVPEPSTALLAGAGIALVLTRVRRSRRI